MHICIRICETEAEVEVAVVEVSVGDVGTYTMVVEEIDRSSAVGESVLVCTVCKHCIYTHIYVYICGLWIYE